MRGTEENKCINIKYFSILLQNFYFSSNLNCMIAVWVYLSITTHILPTMFFNKPALKVFWKEYYTQMHWGSFYYVTWRKKPISVYLHKKFLLKWLNSL